MFVILVLNEAFVIIRDDTKFETFVNEEVTRLNVLEILVTLALRSQQFAETFIQQEFRKV